MSDENTEMTWDKIDLTDPADRSLITDISETLANLSTKKRAERKRQKLREELVREHIENRNRAPTFLQALAARFVK